MNLLECLQSMQGYGIRLNRRGAGLVIQSTTFKPNDQQKAILKAYKGLLLAIMPGGEGQTPGVLLDAVEAYQERVAIMQDAGDVEPANVEAVALRQARRVLLPDIHPQPC